MKPNWRMVCGSLPLYIVGMMFVTARLFANLTEGMIGEPVPGVGPLVDAIAELVNSIEDWIADD